MVDDADQRVIADAYHTMDELYDHRCLLFVALMRTYPRLAWRARLHADGSGEPGWWIAGLRLPAGEVSYHLPDRLWSLLDGLGVDTLHRAPAWDGHTSQDVLQRLRAWLESATPGSRSEGDSS